MNATNATLPCTVDVNTDVTGIGVRVSLYVATAFGLILASICGPKDMEMFRETARASYLTSSGLAIAGFISLQNGNGLSVLDALCITSMTSLMTTYTFCSLAFWPMKVDEEDDDVPISLSLLTSLVMHTCLWMAFGIHFWTNLAAFGSINSCSPNTDAMFWLFGHKVATTDAKVGLLALVAFAGGGPAWFTLALLRFISPAFPWFRLGRLGWRRWPRWATRLVGLVLGFAIFFYLVITTEQIITINGARGATSQMSFGQILALLLLVDSLFKFGSAIWKKRCGDAAPAAVPRNDEIELMIDPLREGS